MRVLAVTGAVIGQRNVCTEDPCNDRATGVKASTVVNMKAGYEAENWSIFAFARNLLNEDYLTQRNAPENSDRRLGRTGEPRVLGVELNLKFGGLPYARSAIFNNLEHLLLVEYRNRSTDHLMPALSGKRTLNGFEI